MTTNLEIERKFLLDGAKVKKFICSDKGFDIDYKFINQYYLTDKNSDDEVRVREIHTFTSINTISKQFYKTTKRTVSSGNLLVREENEKELSEEEFLALMPYIKTFLTKKRYTIPLQILSDIIDTNIYMIEIDVYDIVDDIMDGKCIMEIEFQENCPFSNLSPEELFPDFINELIIEEVTGDSKYKNINLVKEYPKLKNLFSKSHNEGDVINENLLRYRIHRIAQRYNPFKYWMRRRK